MGYRVRLPGTGTGNAYGTLRYGLSDDRVTGRVTVVGNVAGGRLALSGYHDIADLDPFSPGRSVGNSVNSLFGGHDNGDYALAGGGSAGFELPIRTGLALIVTGRVEELASVRRVARSAVNDFLGGTGVFPSNPAVDEGTFAGGAARLRGFGPIRWNLTADVLAGDGPDHGQTVWRRSQGLRRRSGGHRTIEGGRGDGAGDAADTLSPGRAGYGAGIRVWCHPGACVLGGSARCEPLQGTGSAGDLPGYGTGFAYSRAYSPDRSSWVVAPESRCSAASSGSTSAERSRPMLGARCASIL